MPICVLFTCYLVISFYVWPYMYLVISFYVWHLSLLMIDIVQVDYDRRKLIAPNHTCTHMLNFALRVCSKDPLSMNL